MIPENSLHEYEDTSSLGHYDLSPPSDATTRSEHVQDGKHHSVQAYNSFKDVSIIELLEHAEGPIFVVDIKDLAYLRAIKLVVRLPITYQNQVMRTSGVLLNAVNGQNEADYARFRAWILSVSKTGQDENHSYQDFIWHAYTIRKRWRIISGVRKGMRSLLDQRDSSNVSGLLPNSSEASSENASARFKDRRTNTKDSLHGSSAKTISTKDSADSPLSLENDKVPATLESSNLASESSNYADFVRGFDWGSTALGPMDSWSHQLRTMVDMIIATPTPTFLHWGDSQGRELGNTPSLGEGPQLTCLYSESAIPFVGTGHPFAFGKDPRIAFENGMNALMPFIQKSLITKRGVRVDNLPVSMDRGFGSNEETFFSLALVPIVDGEDTIIGWVQQTFEQTKVKLAERRMDTLLRLSEGITSCPNRKIFWGRTLQAISQNPRDICFALLYSSTESTEVRKRSLSELASDGFQARNLGLEGIFGIPPNHPAVLNRLQIEASRGQEGFIPYFTKALDISEPLHLRLTDGTLPDYLVAGITSPTFSDACDAVLICPIRSTTGTPSTHNTALGFLIIGLNPRRPYDDDYRSFINLLLRQIQSAMASVLLLEEEIHHGLSIAEQAAVEQRNIEEEMASRTEELKRKEGYYKRLCDIVPVALFVMEYLPGDTNGSYTYRNDKWFEMTADDRTEGWLRATEGAGTRMEYRVKMRGAEDDHSPENYNCVLLNAVSSRNEDGSLKAIIATGSDITVNKVAEVLQRQRIEDAVESKRILEQFIDVTSHEMRNPLSAIMISAEDIFKTTSSLKAAIQGQNQSVLSLVEEIKDAAETILHCTQHQKRIVDDVLTISKMDSGLFNVSPEEVNVVKVVKHVLRMLEKDFTAKDIQTRLAIEDSFTEHDIGSVLLDPNRLVQILMNLLTNSIKFTAGRPTRVITVHLDASLEEPKHDHGGVEFLVPKKRKEDLTLRPEWGEGRIMFLIFAVEDSGCGLEDTSILFNRFSQAPKTHVNYGGSGLGLFISRELSEMQGGAIGVSSVFGLGSKFAFYIKSRLPVSLVRPPLPNFEAFESLRPMPADLAVGTSFSVPPDLNTLQSEPNQPSWVDKGTEPSPAVSPNVAARFATTTPLTSPPVCFDVLLVEDNKINQQVLSKQLRKAGHGVRIANHGVEAIDAINESVYWRGHESDGVHLSVVLLDIEMPVMDGLTCIKRIRELQAEGIVVKHLPVIAITANARAEQVKEYHEAGMVRPPLM
ncbi:hypothetical protein BU16DRAFT_554411 [Lophium mytilinum]|uniref:histidine kinase n=1 Tax=Lophium mytilinum TaxID=390894 RepID=A0A6A6RC28_9PEZI|nr:hypothetical protein BU16DRAFT_554411 [Lophium mytilinum]